MKNWLENPKQSFLLFTLATLFGFISLQQLPIFLYPKSNRPVYEASFRMSSMDSRDFLDQYGYRFYQALQQIDDMETVEIGGYTRAITFTATFEWGSDPRQAKQNFITAYESFRGSLPYDIQRQSRYSKGQQNGGFFAASVYHPDMRLSQLHEMTEPTILPEVSKIKGIEDAFLYDPDATNAFITLDPEKLAMHRLNIDEVSRYVEDSLTDISAGSVRLSGSRYELIVKNQATSFGALLDLGLEGLERPGLKLTDIAKVDMLPREESEQVMRTNGVRSLVLYVRASDDGNLKLICESAIKILENAKSNWPSGTEFKTLVDPSEFIRSAIDNVIINIFLGGGLAVLVFFLFTGSLRSTIFTSVEIPLAMIWAFILMNLFDVSLNLISLGGLALTAGMNIDASVVVVENILRHFQENPVNSKKQRIERILEAVKEVRWPVITSTFSTCIVFLPLSQTSGIAYSILGDLAKAVVFSHSFSAVVALVLVPIVRSFVPFEKDDQNKTSKMAVMKNLLDWINQKYNNSLNYLLERPSRSLSFCLVTLLVGSSIVVSIYPFIRKEIVAVPTTSFIWVDVRADDFNSVGEMAQELRQPEQLLLNELKNDILHTFVTIRSARRASILIRIRNKNDSEKLITEISKLLPSTPEISYEADNFNPSQLPIPDPPDLRLLISGPEKQRLLLADRMEFEIQANKKIQSVRNSVDRDSVLYLVPNTNYLNNIDGSVSAGVQLAGDITEALLREKSLGFIETDKGSNEVFIRFPPNYIQTAEGLAAFPWVIGDQVVPLSALMSVDWGTTLFGLYQENGQELTYVEARVTPEEKYNVHEVMEDVKKQFAGLEIPEEVNLIYEDPDKETNESLIGVLYALLISLVLIFSILIWQFGRIVDAFLIMSAIPLGIIGVSLSLWALSSTWSINSLLGTILLGGIAVNNSILLVSFFHFYKDKGDSVKQAILKSCDTRFRPILITSLTTIIAMLPIALGFGDGAEVLKPLGIAVSGGMVFSTGLILFIIPCLVHLTYRDQDDVSREVRL